jgi:hypothetical protein
MMRMGADEEREKENSPQRTQRGTEEKNMSEWTKWTYTAL